MYLSSFSAEKIDQVVLVKTQGQKYTKTWRNSTSKAYIYPNRDHATYDSIHCAPLDGWKTAKNGEENVLLGTGDSISANVITINVCFFRLSRKKNDRRMYN